LTEVTEGAGLFIDRLDAIGIALESGFKRRLAQIGDVGRDWSAFVDSLATNHAPGTFAAIVIGTVLASALAFHGVRYLLGRSTSKALPSVRPLREIASAFLAALIIVILLRFSLVDEIERHVARVWGIAAILGLLFGRLVTGLLHSNAGQDLPGPRLASFARILSAGSAWGFLGLAALATLKAWNAGPALRDMTGLFIVSLPTTVLLVYAYWHHRKAIAMAVAGPEPRSPWRAHFASAWPTLAILALVGTFLALQIGVTVERPLPGLAMLGTLLLVLVAPHVDSAIGAWVERKADDPSTSLLAATFRRMARFAFAVLVIGLLAYLWALPALTAIGFNVTLISTRAVEMILVALVGALLWNVTAASIERVRAKEHREPDAETEGNTHAPRTRLETLLPLLQGTAKASIFVLSVLTILVILDVNVWPLITGLSVFGLAIGFGSQTLVKDIVSGLFFLLDDAFRLGEYIETSGAKGMVERISVRSVSLRHPRGAIATIPYGQIGKIQNYSRDWVIEKLVFRVAFDTDVDKVRKLFKQIGQEIADDPDLSGDLLETFKSQGIASVEDGTLLVRGKFKARAGKQFAIRKAVYLAIQRTFRENGIVAVPKPITFAAAADRLSGIR